MQYSTQDNCSCWEPYFIQCSQSLHGPTWVPGISFLPFVVPSLSYILDHPQSICLSCVPHCFSLVLVFLFLQCTMAVFVLMPSSQMPIVLTISWHFFMVALIWSARIKSSSNRPISTLIEQVFIFLLLVCFLPNKTVSPNSFAPSTFTVFIRYAYLLCQ